MNLSPAAFLALLSLSASLLSGREVYLSEPVSDTTVAPYHSIGRVTILGKWRGSGVVAGGVHTFLTAGHVLFDTEQGEWVSAVRWSGAVDPNEIEVRNFRVLSSYADAVLEQGGNSREAFAQDTGVGISYEAFSESPALLADDPISAVTSSQDKLIAGYGTFGTGLSQTGPFAYAFDSVLGNYYNTADVSLGPGGSGGGLWTRVESSWELSGIYVAGLDERLGDQRNVAGIVVLNPTLDGLLADALAFAAPQPPSILEAPDSLVINWGESEAIEISFDGFPEPEAVWERRFNGIVVTHRSGVSAAPGIARLSFQREQSVSLGTEFRVILSNASGTVESAWIPVAIAGAQLPVFVQQPVDLTLGTGEAGAFEAAVEGTPAPSFQWQYLHRHGEFQDFSGMEGSRSARLVVPADNLEYADMVFRLRASNSQGSVVSDPVRLTVPVPEFGGSYTQIPDAFLASGEETGVAAEIFGEEALLSWRVRYPSGGRRESGFDGGGFTTLGWVDYQGDSLVLNNDGTIQNGTIIQGVVTRFRMNYAGGTLEDEFVLPEIVLWAEGPSRITRQPEIVVDEELGVVARAAFSAARGAVAEWQVWDPTAGVWRPVDLGAGWTSHHSETVALLGRSRGGIAARLRLILRADGAPPKISEELDVIFPGPLPRGLETVTADFDGYEIVGSIAVDDRLISTLRSPGSSDFDLLVIERGENGWLANRSDLFLPAPFELAANFAGGNRMLVLGNSATPADELHQGGSVIVVHEDLKGVWQAGDELRVPKLKYDGGFPAGIELIGDTLVVESYHRDVLPAESGPPGSERFIHLFRRGSDGRFQFVRSLIGASDGLPDGWSGLTNGPIPFRNGFLLHDHRGSPFAPAAPETDILYLEYEESVQDYRIEHVGTTLNPPGVSAGGKELWRVFYWPPTEHWHRILFDEDGKISEELLESPPVGVSLMAKSDGDLIWARKSSQSNLPTVPITIYRRGEKGNLEGPATIPPSDWDSTVASYADSEVYFGDEVVFVAASHFGHRVDIVPKSALRFRNAEAIALKWSQVLDTPDKETWTIRYRAAKDLSATTRVQYSSNLIDWNLLPEQEDTLIESDIDGDGATELRELRLPRLREGDPVLYRLIEMERTN